MKLIRIYNEEAKPICTTPFIKEHTDGSIKNYHNVVFGSTHLNSTKFILCLDKDVFGKPTSKQDRLTLEDDDYVLLEIPKKENNGNNKNSFFLLSKDDGCIHKKDVLVFWELPNKNYEDVKYEIEGTYNIIAETSFEKIRSSNKFKSKAVVAELLTDCKLTWFACNQKQTITFDYKNSNFNWGIIETINNDKES